MNINNRTISEVRALLQDEEVISEQLLTAMKLDSRVGIQELLKKYYRRQEALRKSKKQKNY